MLCSFCEFNGTVVPSDDVESYRDTKMVTVINGQATCMFHAPDVIAVGGTDWRTIQDYIQKDSPPPVRDW